MRKISIPIFQKLTIPIGQTEAILDLQGMQEMKSQCFHVVAGALAIESVITDILKKTLFRELTNDLEFVSGLLLESKWCSFAQKRDLLFSVINRDKILTGQAKDKLQKDIGNVIRWRNAFAHGDLQIIGDKIVLKYFDSAPQEKIITDQLWETVERELLEPFESLNDINSKLNPSSSA